MTLRFHWFAFFVRIAVDNAGNRTNYCFAAANLSHGKCLCNKGLGVYLRDSLRTANRQDLVRKKLSYEMVTSYCFWVTSIVAIMGQWSETPRRDAER